MEEWVARTTHIWTRMHVWHGAGMLIRVTKESRAHERSKAQTKVSTWTVKCLQQGQNELEGDVGNLRLTFCDILVNAEQHGIARAFANELFFVEEASE